MTARPITYSRWRDYVRAGRRKIETTIAVLDSISRTRALSMEESLQLERAIKAEGYSGRTWLSWQPEEDATALQMRERGQKPAEIALTLHRSPDAVAARLRKLSQPRLVER